MSVVEAVDRNRQNAYATCRALRRHKMEPNDSIPSPERRFRWVFHLAVERERCGMIAHLYWDGMFHRIGPCRYQPPPGYRYTKDEMPTKEYFTKLLLGERVERRRLSVVGG